MPISSCTALLLALATVAACATAPPEPVRPLPRPTAAQLAFHDMEVGAFIHFMPSTWPVAEGSHVYDLASIRPDRINTDQWVRAARSMGARYIVSVAKHAPGVPLLADRGYPVRYEAVGMARGTSRHCGRPRPFLSQAGNPPRDLQHVGLAQESGAGIADRQIGALGSRLGLSIKATGAILIADTDNSAIQRYIDQTPLQ